MAKKYDTIRPLLQKVKQAQASGQGIYLNLQKEPQQTISDITNVATLANKAGLLPNYKYLKSPKYQLFCDSPRSPVAINFFTGQWLELFALSVVREIEIMAATPLSPFCGVHVELPNGDQFDLDLVLSIANRLIWVEAKTTNNFGDLLPKYKKISELLCASAEDAILLWSGFDEMDKVQATRGTLARMTVCSPRQFPTYVRNLLKQYGVELTENELA
ncbi:hypothetical protein [Hydrogenophilus hirschii]